MKFQSTRLNFHPLSPYPLTRTSTVELAASETTTTAETREHAHSSKFTWAPWA